MMGLLPDAFEAAVMIVGVEKLHRWRAAGDDAPRAAIAGTRRLHRVLVIIPSGFERKQPLPVSEDDAILPVGKRPTLAYQRQRFACLPGQFDRADLACVL